MLKRMSKCLLALSLLLTGVMLTPKETYANDISIEPKASNITYGYLTRTIQNTDIGGNVTIKLRVSYMNTGSETIMNFVSSGSYCTSTRTDVTCAISNATASGYSSTTSADVLRIEFKVSLSRTGGAESFNCLLTALRNNINSFEAISG